MGTHLIAEAASNERAEGLPAALEVDAGRRVLRVVVRVAAAQLANAHGVGGHAVAAAAVAAVPSAATLKGAVRQHLAWHFLMR